MWAVWQWFLKLTFPFKKTFSLKYLPFKLIASSEKSKTSHVHSPAISRLEIDKNEAPPNFSDKNRDVFYSSTLTVRDKNNAFFDTLTFPHSIPGAVLLMAVGIGLYFKLPFEGNGKLVAVLLIGCATLWLFSFSMPRINGFVALFLIILIGYSAALYRTQASYTPLLSKSLQSYSFVLMVEQITPLQRSSIRYTGQVISLGNFSPAHRPKRIRIRTTDQGPRYNYGDLICGRAILARPKGPLRPGGYDFGQVLWYQQIGGTGFTISALRLCKQQSSKFNHHSGLSSLIANIRTYIGIRLDRHLNEPHRSLARALIIGDRGRIRRDDLIALRKAGLGHLLAISGLHMAVFAGTVFFFIRGLFALFPVFTQCHPIKKWSALIALVAGACYFLISGQSIPTQRAFIMISVVFTAIMVERTALTLRNVALAALLILAVRPESLLSPGFQMSFAAVTALVASFQYNLKYQPLGFLEKQSWTKPFYYLGGIWITSVVASLATAPFAAFHFHNISYMGPVGNMLAIPVFSLLLMPAAVFSLVLMPFGLEQIALFPLKYFIDMLLSSAHWTASFDPAVIFIGAISLTSVLMLVIGVLVLLFIKRPTQYLSLPFLLIGILLAAKTEKPVLYVAAKGNVIALRGPDDLLYAPDGRKGTYTLGKWLQADGDSRTASDARNSPYLRCDDHACSGTKSGLKVTMLKSINALVQECGSADILIYERIITRKCKTPFIVLDKSRLGQSGAHAVYVNNGKIRIETANSFRKNRIWSGYK